MARFALEEASRLVIVAQLLGLRAGLASDAGY